MSSFEEGRCCSNVVRCAFCLTPHQDECAHVEEVSIRIPGVGKRDQPWTWAYYNDDSWSIEYLCSTCLFESGLECDPWVSGGIKANRTIVTRAFLQLQMQRLETHKRHLSRQQTRIKRMLDEYDLDSECWDAEEVPKKKRKQCI